MDWYLLHFCEEHYQSDTDSTRSSNSLGTYASFNQSSSNLEQLIEHDSDTSDVDLFLKNSKDHPLKDLLTCDSMDKMRYSTNRTKTKDSWMELNPSQQTKHSSLSDLLLATVNDNLEGNRANEVKKLREGNKLFYVIFSRLDLIGFPKGLL